MFIIMIHEWDWEMWIIDNLIFLSFHQWDDSKSFCVINLMMQRIQYAKTKSDCIAKEEGSYVPREKKKKQEEKGEQYWSINTFQTIFLLIYWILF